MQWKDMLLTFLKLNGRRHYRSADIARCVRNRHLPHETFYDIAGWAFGKTSLVIPEFRTGCWGDAIHLPDESVDDRHSIEIPQEDEKGHINIGPVKQIYGHNWDFGDMYSPSPPPPRMAAPEPASASGRPGPKPEISLEPINPVWPMGIPHGKQWRGRAFPDLRILISLLRVILSFLWKRDGPKYFLEIVLWYITNPRRMIFILPKTIWRKGGLLG